MNAKQTTPVATESVANEPKGSEAGEFSATVELVHSGRDDNPSFGNIAAIAVESDGTFAGTTLNGEEFADEAAAFDFFVTAVGRVLRDSYSQAKDQTDARKKVNAYLTRLLAGEIGTRESVGTSYSVGWQMLYALPKVDAINSKYGVDIPAKKADRTKVKAKDKRRILDVLFEKADTFKANVDAEIERRKAAKVTTDSIGL